MATLKLKKKPADDSTAHKAGRPPVRGVGSGVSRKRPTLAEAQARRNEQEARYQEQVRHRYGDNPPARFSRAGDGPPMEAGGRGRGRGPQGGQPAAARDAGPSFDRPRDGGRGAPDRQRREAGDHRPARREQAPASAWQGGRGQEPESRHRGPSGDLRQERAPSARGTRQGGNTAFGAPVQRGGSNTAFGGGARPAPSPGPSHRDERGPGRRDPRDRDDARPPRRADARSGPGNPAYNDAPRRGPQRDEPRHAQPDPGLRREDQRRRSGSNRPPEDSHRTPWPRGEAPEPRQRPWPRHASNRQDEDDDDDAPSHAEHAPGSVRLSKRMSEMGMSSRREADEWIPKGWVRVDGRVVKELGSRVMPGQHISIDAKARHQQDARVTVLINKPVGYVSGQAEDGYEPALVLVTPENQWREDRSSIRFLHSHLRNLAPAGRLDIDSVGLLVLTQDGRVAKQLIGEDSEIEKEYLVRVQTKDGQPLPDESLALLRHGLELDGQALRPAQVEWVNDDQLRFVLKEGRKRQIRRMCEAVGLDVLGLKRVRIGRVMLGDLPPGQWRYLRGDEGFDAA